MKYKYYFALSVLLVSLCFPADVYGQLIRKETIGNKTYAIIYAEGLSGAAQWQPGFNMMSAVSGSSKKRATIRHQVSRGNGGNLSVNDRIPFRFIVAPTDVADVSWMKAGGVTGGDGNLNTDFAGEDQSGCGSYGAPGQPGEGRTWRLPTQRELQLMWIFRGPVGIIYPNAPMENGSTKNYWASTEKDAGNAWFFDFKQGAPVCSWQLKSTLGYGRCVSDY